MSIKQIDYRIQGYKKKKTNNDLGDRSLVEYYGGESSGVFTDLKVKEERSHQRSTIGIPQSTTVVISWYGSDKTAPRATKTIIKPLDLDDGMKVNENSRGRLVNKAKGGAIQLLGLSAGKVFMTSVALELSLYREGEIQPLVDAINNSTESATFKATLTSILDKSYIPV